MSEENKDYQEENSKSSVGKISVGAILQEARKKQKKELSTIANRLCIRKVYLEALEDNSIQRLLTRAYAIGFLRTYSEYLKLNVDSLIEQFQLENPEPIQTAKSSMDDTIPLYQNTKYISMKYLILLGGSLLVILALYGLISLFSSDKESHEAENQVVQIENIVPLIPETQPVSETLESETKSETPIAPGVTKETQTAPSPSLGVNPSETPVSTTEQKPAFVMSKKASNIITLMAESDAWVELINMETGHIVFSRVLKQGENYEMTEDANVSLTTGNAGGLAVYVGNTKISQLGPLGVRRSFIRMDGKSLLEKANKKAE